MRRIKADFSHLCLSVFICGLAAFGAATPAPAMAQDWFRTGTGLGVDKARLAAADFAHRNEQVQPASTYHTPLSNTFNAVLWSDLEYSGILDMVSKSFYPLAKPTVPGELNHAAWNAEPALAHFLALGNVANQGEDMILEAWLFDVRNPEAPPVLGKRYRGAATQEEARRLAHQFADEIVAALSGGLPGISSTRIAFVSNRTGHKEIWAMDFDGANQRALTSLRTISLTPRWSPDTSRIAFTCWSEARNRGASPQVCMHSMDTGKPVAFARYRGTNAMPAWSADGSAIMFMSSMNGDPELFVIPVSGGTPKRITFSPGADTSPAWNPRTGQTVAFVSDRGGIPQLYMMNADGSNVRKLVLPDSMGYVIDPAWSPNGQLLAFAWRRPGGNYDIYVMDPASGQIVALTRDAGRNERPSWAPDGRHIVFESTRSGSRQIWSMLADGTQARQLTFEGHNESPNWSPR